MQRTAVINVVGLSPDLITENETPFLHAYRASAASLPIKPIVPAVTTTVQSTYLTGRLPCEHGIVGNGWYSREDAEVKFWKQSNHLVQSPKVWETARARDATATFTVANSFWWYNMYSSVDYAITPRPMYPADGRKLPDVHSHPQSLRHDLQARLGQFPLFSFWGPRADITSSRWIVDAAKILEELHSPTLHLVYLPHLDYVLQKHGPGVSTAAKELAEIDALLADLVPYLESRGVSVLLLSEYGITAVDTPIHINRALRHAGLIEVRTELDRELLDAGASRAFAVSDHQVAHVYVNDPAHYQDALAAVRDLPGVARVLEADAKQEEGLDHARSGDFVVLAEPNAWFTYYYWLDDDVAPDFARCVDIHRKPGYDPVELFVDPEISFPSLTAAWKLAQKQLGFRYLMDLIPLDASLVKGSHGAGAADAICLTKRKDLVEGRDKLHAVEVHDLILSHLGL